MESEGSPLNQNIPGGKAEGIEPNEYDVEELANGTRIEMEHTDDPTVAAEIAMDHLTEDQNYYKKPLPDKIPPVSPMKAKASASGLAELKDFYATTTELLDEASRLGLTTSRTPSAVVVVSGGTSVMYRPIADSFGAWRRETLLAHKVSGDSGRKGLNVTSREMDPAKIPVDRIHQYQRIPALLAVGQDQAEVAIDKVLYDEFKKPNKIILNVAVQDATRLNLGERVELTINPTHKTLSDLGIKVFVKETVAAKFKCEKCGKNFDERYSPTGELGPTCMVCTSKKEDLQKHINCSEIPHTYLQAKEHFRKAKNRPPIQDSEIVGDIPEYKGYWMDSVTGELVRKAEEPLTDADPFDSPSPVAKTCPSCKRPMSHSVKVGDDEVCTNCDEKRISQGDRVLAAAVYARAILAYVRHRPGHKNSKGESAPWVIEDHSDSHVVGSYSSESEAKKALRRMKAFGHSTLTAVDVKEWQRLMREKERMSKEYHEVVGDPAHGVEPKDVVYYEGMEIRRLKYYWGVYPIGGGDIPVIVLPSLRDAKQFIDSNRNVTAALTRSLSDLEKELTDAGVALPPPGSYGKKELVELLKTYHWDKEHPGEDMPKFVSPMLLKNTKDLPPNKVKEMFESPDWYVEQKRDGVRCVVDYDSSGKPRAYSRNISTKNYLPSSMTSVLFWMPTSPALANTTLDGEVISTKPDIDTSKYTKGGKGGITADVLQAVVALTSIEKTKEAQEANGMPLRYVIYDITRHNGKDLMKSNYLERRKVMEAAVKLASENSDKVLLNPSTNEGKMKIWEDVIEKGGEGIVFKHKDLTYQEGVRAPGSFKHKTKTELDCVVTGFIPPQSGAYLKEGLVGGLVFSCKDTATGEWHEVGASSALDLETRRAISEKNADGTFKGVKDGIVGKWIFEVEFRGWSRTYRMVHARPLRRRDGDTADSKSPDECTFDFAAVKASVDAMSHTASISKLSVLKIQFSVDRGDYIASYMLDVEYESEGPVDQFISEVKVLRGIENQDEEHGGDRPLSPAELKEIEDNNQEDLADKVSSSMMDVESDYHPETFDKDDRVTLRSKRYPESEGRKGTVTLVEPSGYEFVDGGENHFPETYEVRWDTPALRKDPSEGTSFTAQELRILWED